MYSKNLALKNEYIPLDNNIEDYILNLIDGNKEALVSLYESTKTAIYGFVFSILKNKHDAEDVFQEVYIKVYENAHLYKESGKPMAWLLTISKNLCYEKLRKQKDHQDIDGIYDLKDNQNQEMLVENKIMLNIMFKHLTNEERKIIILHVVSGLKHREIAKLLDIPLSTVLSKYNRSIKRIKKIFKEEMK